MHAASITTNWRVANLRQDRICNLLGNDLKDNDNNTTDCSQINCAQYVGRTEQFEVHDHPSIDCQQSQKDEVEEEPESNQQCLL
jgi:hypothetical protein